MRYESTHKVRGHIPTACHALTIFLTSHESIIIKEPPLTLTNKNTFWKYFKQMLSNVDNHVEISSKCVAS